MNKYEYVDEDGWCGIEKDGRSVGHAKVVDDIKELQAELDAYKAHVTELRNHIREGLEPANEFGDYLGETTALLSKTPKQSLADIQAKAIMDASNEVLRHTDAGFCIHCSMHDYANYIKEGGIKEGG